MVDDMEEIVMAFLFEDSHRQTVVARFSPKEDITAYELAIIVGNIGAVGYGNLFTNNVYIPAEKWEDIPPEVRRHFETNQ
jgi:hypothetical protein